MADEFDLSDFEDFLEAIESEEAAAIAEDDTDIGPLEGRTSQVEVTSQETGIQEKKKATTAKKARMLYPEKIFKQSDVSAGATFKMVLESVPTEPVFQLLTPVASQVKHLARHLLEGIESDDMQSFSSVVVEGVWNLIEPLQGLSWSEKKRAEMWQQFHNFRGSDMVLHKWQCLLRNIGQWKDTVSEIILLQHILNKVHKSLMFQLLKTDMPQDESVDSNPILEPHEEQALRYCAGYVPFKLIKRYRKVRNSETADKFVNVLSTWAQIPDKDDTGFLTYTEDWISAQNRGGLFSINDDTFRFFRCMEKVTQLTLKSKNFATLHQTNVKGLLMDKINNDKFVHNMWSKLCNDLSSELRSKLLEEVMKCFVTMRVNAYLRVVQMIQKEKSVLVSKKGEKSLRKELSS